MRSITPLLCLYLLACRGPELSPDSGEAPATEDSASVTDDADGDGWAPPEDCDDDDPEVHPGASEVCGDEVDQDCDGFARECGEVISAGDALIFSGVEGEDHLGTAVSSAGDLNGDGLGDVLLGAAGYGEDDQGGACLFLSPFPEPRTIDNAARCFTGTSNWSLGSRLFGGVDLDGDGLGEIGLGAQDAEASAEEVWLFSGEEGIGPEPDAIATLDVSIPLGFPTVADFSYGAGEAGVLIGDPDNDEAGVDAGIVYLFSAPFTGARTLSDADARWSGADGYDRAGAAMASAGDVDGDGAADLLIGAPYRFVEGYYRGSTYLILGASGSGGGSLADADARFDGISYGAHAGSGVGSAGDVDGDGLHDLLIKGSGNEAEPEGAGAIYLVLASGIGEGARPLSTADARFFGAGERRVSSFAGPGDLDGDGFADLAVGASGKEPGAVYLIFGPTSGTWSPSTAPLAIEGERQVGSGFGGEIVGVGDADGDGVDDLLISDPGRQRGAAGVGAAYLVSASHGGFGGLR